MYNYYYQGRAKNINDPKEMQSLQVRIGNIEYKSNIREFKLLLLPDSKYIFNRIDVEFELEFLTPIISKEISQFYSIEFPRTLLNPYCGSYDSCMHITRHDTLDLCSDLIEQFPPVYEAMELPSMNMRCCKHEFFNSNDGEATKFGTFRFSSHNE